MPGPTTPTPDTPTRNEDQVLPQDAIASADGATPDASVAGEKAATPGTAASSSPKVSPFPAKKLAELAPGDPDLQKRLDPIGKDKRFATLSFAVALLDDPTSPRIPYFGWYDEKQKFGASLVKIAAMTAAYALRDAVQRAAENRPADGAEDLLKQITAAWTEPVSNALPEGKPDFPNLLGSNLAGSSLKGIFAVSPAGDEGQWAIDFTSKQILADTTDPIAAMNPSKRRDRYSDINDLADSAKPKDLKFRERMELMIGWSDNWFAGTCIDDLGFQYISGCMRALGLFDPQRQLGLWLSSNYAHRTWSGKGLKLPGDPKDGDKRYQGATARAIMRFLVALAADKLISETASQEMRQLINKTDEAHPPFVGVTSLVKKALGTARGTIREIDSKVGYLLGNKNLKVNCSDCAIVTRDLGNGGTKRYGIVVLNIPDENVLTALVQAIDSALTAAHA